MKKHNIKNTVVVFTLITVIAKIIAFGRELLLSYFYGANTISDVFLLSMTLPVTVFGFVVVGVTSGYIPIYQKAKTEKNERTALTFTNSVINLLLIFCLIAIIVYYLFPRSILGLFAIGFDDYALELACNFTNISIFAVIFIAIITVLTGFLQINDSIKITACISLPLNLGVIISILIAYLYQNIYFLPVGFLISTGLQVLFISVISFRKGFRYLPVLNLKDEYMTLFITNVGILILSGSLSQINMLIDRTLATTVAVGGLSWFEYSNKINDFAMGLTVIPICSAMFPIMTESKDNPTELRKALEDGFSLSSIIIIPISIIIVVFSEPIVRIIYMRGAFNQEDAYQTSRIVLFYGIGLFAFSVRELLLRCYYSIGDVKTPLINSSIGIVFNILLNFVLLKLIGLPGLALATSIAALLTDFLLVVSLKKRGLIRILYVFIRCTKLFVISLVSCGVAYLGFVFLMSMINSTFISFAFAFVLFFVLYSAITLLTGIIDRHSIASIFKK